MPQIKSFIIYQNYKKIFEKLSMEQRGQLITAIFDYTENGELTTSLDSLCDMAFAIIKDTLDRDREKYEEVRKKRVSAGSLGAKIKKQMLQEKSTCFSDEAKQAVNGNVNVNVNDNVNVNGSGNGNDTNADATPTTLTSKEIKELEEDGIPREYIDHVRDRAEYYSGIRGADVCGQIREWWEVDRANPKWAKAKVSSKPKRASPSAVDYDEWLKLRLEQTFADDEFGT